ncbi:MAG TPA: VOC family protein [Candidatus Cybelea sp.]|nr:VOC family protein [Candidatus Cybelea sp.]
MAKPSTRVAARDYRTVTPYLSVVGANAAIDFYKNAFGAVELMRMPADDGVRLMHAEILIDDSIVMISDVFPEYGALPPAGGVVLHLSVDDADAWFARAIDAGALVDMPLEDMFWGDRFGRVKDPFGHTWSVATPLQKPKPAKAAKAAKRKAAKKVKKAAKPKRGKARKAAKRAKRQRGR